jgi:hypothetical protein
MIKAFQWDLARQVERLDILLRWLPRYAEWGYEELYLHLEDAVAYPSLPGVARPGAYSRRQFARLVDAATAAGIRVVPIVNLLGHTQYLVKVPALRDLNELRDAAGRPRAQGQICPLHPRTLAVADALLRDLAPFCTAGRVHVGLDESFLLGRCPRCRAEIGRRGLAAHFAGHVRRLHRLAADRGLKLGLWADMLALLPAAIPELPRDVTAYDWYYYPFARHPRVELRNFAKIDLATPLRARGIEYWGCPMNGAFRYEPMPVFGDRLENIVDWWRRCQRVGAGGFLVTSWEANRLAIELTTAVDAAAACLWLNPGIEDPREMLARGFARVFGRGASQGHARRVRGNAPHLSQARQWAAAALAGDQYAFAGYHRWQINERWDVCAGRGELKRAVGELHAIEESCRSLLAGDVGNRLQAGSYKKRVPSALAASLAFRLYLARRDVFVRRAAQAVFQLRRSSSAGIPRSWAGGTDLPTRESPHPGRETRATPERGRKHRATLAKFRVTVDRLQQEAVAFAAVIRAGRATARTMWARSRDPRVRGPNERMISNDAKRLAVWRRWLARATRQPALVWQATPVCGVWQLQFTVHHFAPAMQKIVVEQPGPDGAWTTLHQSHLIEFRSFAAQSRTAIRREFSVPIPVAHSAKFGPRAVTPAIVRVRLAVRGLGQVGIGDVALTNGGVILRVPGWPRAHRKVLGRPAPRRGFPKLDWSRNRGDAVLRFALPAFSDSPWPASREP